MLKEYAFLVPARLNSGMPVPELLRAYIHSTCDEMFGGWHMQPGNPGNWRSPAGVDFPEVMDAYVVASPDAEIVLGTVQEFGMLLEQETMYARMPGGIVVPIQISTKAAVIARGGSGDVPRALIKHDVLKARRNRGRLQFPRERMIGVGRKRQRRGRRRWRSY